MGFIGPAFRQLKVATLLILAGLTAVSCRPAPKGPFEETVERNEEVAPGAVLSVKNPEGSIKIHGSAGSRVSFKATKKATSEDQFSRTKIDFSAGSQAVSIETKYPSQKALLASGPPVTVDYEISVPRTMNISRVDLNNGDVLLDGIDGDVATVSAVNGRLLLRNSFGNIHATVANGSLNISYDRWEKRAFALTTQILSGDASLTLPRGAAFHLVADSPNGKVTNEFGGRLPEIAGRSAKTDIFEGEGVRANIEIQATLGNVAVMKGPAVAGAQDPVVQVVPDK